MSPEGGSEAGRWWGGPAAKALLAVLWDRRLSGLRGRQTHLPLPQYLLRFYAENDFGRERAGPTAAPQGE